MARASAAVLAKAVLLLAVGEATESSTCAPGACPTQEQVLLQSKKVMWKAPQLDGDGKHLVQPHVSELQQKNGAKEAAQRQEQEGLGHRVVLELPQLKNGTSVMPTALLQLRVASGSVGVLTQADKETLLSEHNYLRCLHGSSPVTWDDAIAQNAQAWADKGIYEHSANSQRKVNGELLGENLAWGWPSRTAESSVNGWYDEIQYTDGTPSSCTDRTEPEDICHYTQVVWAASTKLGCGLGKASVTIGDKTYADGDHYVCQYGPAGNFEGQFGANVLAPTVSEEDCKSYRPAPVEETATGGNCKDQGKMEGPLIQGPSGYMGCDDLKPGIGWYCSNYGFVVTKCPASCGAC